MEFVICKKEQRPPGRFFLSGRKFSIYYGRILGKVLLNEEGMNLEQLRAGLAWHYKKYQKEQSPEDRELLSNAETEAREESGAYDTTLRQVIGIS